ncbi:phosphatase PAP2 family protein [Dactylosporangium sp. AC04546]|uniref:phosphatase PAP2 family protein n=1 Tax=Dactylosporangium sp. AC04546 TaxID=2862460 RepID=UPI001EDFF4B2|nr:phosphatase PAP2 family protein [Dactylosporangium sp. AC04546]WVK84385.1 phosphatase PAP2 family protein [Dactylosporangium sp. AC04546]
MLRPVRPSGWWFDAVLLAGFAAVTLALVWRTPLLDLDLAVRDFVDAHRPGWLDTTLRWCNRLGQGGQVLTPLALIVAFVMTRRRHTIRPFLLVVGAFALTYVTIGPLKLWTDRLAASEPTDPHPELLFHAEQGMSYPSGHVVNAIVWYGVLAALLTGVLRPGLVLAIRYTVPLVLLFTTTYLSFHWLSDGLAAILLGLLLDRVLQRAPWDAVPLGRIDRAGWGAPFFAGPGDRVQSRQAPTNIR